MERLAIIGAGELGKQISHCAKQTKRYEPVGFFDDTQKNRKLSWGLPIIGEINDLDKLYGEDLFDAIIIAIGYKHLSFKEKIYEEYKSKIPFATIVHPSCIIDPTAKIGSGSVLYAGTVVDMNVEIQENVLINLNCTISHDSTIGAHTFMSPSVAIAGFVEIGKNNMLGIGSVFIDNTKTTKAVKTGAATLVIHDLLKPGLYLGSPSKYVS